LTQTVSASAPALVVSSTIKAASLFAAGNAPGAIAPAVTALTEGVLKTMLMTKLKVALAAMLVVVFSGLALYSGFASDGAGDNIDQRGNNRVAIKDGLTDGRLQGPPKKVATNKVIAWGPTVDGIQAGVSLSDEKKVYRLGETVTFAIHV